ncbi:MAG TPA: hypothetical protein VLB76_26745 [Thermoanaerobaculia bacterium]|jgi:hypothetical protein|nr:hypothetical protein [Thermoanaerobaculia bacterium]
MAEPYTVTWTVEVDAEDLVDAARRAYEKLRHTESRPTHFDVKHPKITEALGPGYRYTLVVELPKDNPLGRPPAVVKDDGVCCGHCGSENTRYVEDVGQYAPMSVQDGVPVCWGGDLEVDEIGDDPRVLCFGCGRESELPPNFRWAEGESE